MTLEEINDVEDKTVRLPMLEKHVQRLLKDQREMTTPNLPPTIR